MKNLLIITAVICVGLVGGYAIFWQAHKHADMQKEIHEVQEYRTRAVRGDLIAQYELGVHFFDGKGTPQDYNESERWYRKSADQGYAPAQCALGFMFEQGVGVSKNYAEGMRWYRKAADQGNADAEYNLGTMYRQGMGVLQDYVEAVKWYRMASNQGNANGQYGLGFMYYNGEGVQQDSAEAARLYRQASDQGLARAQYDLAYMYYDGRGVGQDRLEGDRLLHQAAAQGEARALRSLGVNNSGSWGRRKITSLVIFLGCFFFFISSLVPNAGRARIRVLAGMVGMLYAGMDLFLSFGQKIYISETIMHEMTFARNMLLGLFTVMLILIMIRGRRTSLF